MLRVYNVNEFTLLPLLVSVLLGRPAAVLAIDPLMPPMARLLRLVVLPLITNGRLSWAIDHCPGLDQVRDHPTRNLLYNVFGETEAWQNAYFRFSDADASLGNYAMAYKHVTCNYAETRHVPLLVLRELLARQAEQPVRIIGLPVDSVSMLRHFLARELGSAVSPMALPYALLNAPVWIGALLFSLGWVLSRFRPGGVSTEACFLAADYIDDHSDIRLYEEVMDGGPLLLVVRKTWRDVGTIPALAGARFCRAGDGAFSSRGVLDALAFVVRDNVRLLRFGLTAPPALFYRVTLLPYRRAVLRAFFNRFRPRYFWSRDPYNVEHILRRQELRLIGGKSLGINVGYPSYCILFSQFRYLSFDYYFVYGRDLYERYYFDTWDPEMEVIPVGAFRATREQFARRLVRRSRDIAVFCAVYVGEPQMIQLVRGLALEFPDRRIRLQVKNNFAVRDVGSDFVEACTRDLNNVVFSRASVYDLFGEVAYAVSDPSSVIVEAIQFGVVSFAFDVPELQKSSYYRLFPELIVANAEDVAERIRRIENNAWSYPVESYAEVVDISGRYHADTIRKTLGLRPSEAAAGDLADSCGGRPAANRGYFAN